MCLFVSSRYNNQWMIVDYKHFTPGKTDIKDKLFTVLEQIPYVFTRSHHLQPFSIHPAFHEHLLTLTSITSLATAGGW